MDGWGIYFRGTDLADLNLNEALFVESELSDARLSGADLLRTPHGP